jgi:hypothetical protein
LKNVVIFPDLWYVIILPGGIHGTPGKGDFTMTTKLTTIDIELPQDIIFAMRGHKKIGDIKKETKNIIGDYTISRRIDFPWKSSRIGRDEQGEVYRTLERI